MKAPMREALRHTLKELKASMRDRRAKAYHEDDDEKKDEQQDEPTEMVTRRESGRSAGSGAAPRGSSEKVAGKEGTKEPAGELKDEKSSWRDAQKDFMKGRSTRKPISTAKIVENFMPQKKKASAKGSPPKPEKKREMIS